VIKAQPSCLCEGDEVARSNLIVIVRLLPVVRWRRNYVILDYPRLREGKLDYLIT
jgi:hypothetical protein